MERRMMEVAVATSETDTSMPFTEEEITTAKASAGPVAQSRWTECLKIIITCVLHKQSHAEAELSVKAICRMRMQNLRRGDSLLDFAINLEKKIGLAKWQSKIFQPEALWASEEQSAALAAYEVFERSLSPSMVISTRARKKLMLACPRLLQPCAIRGPRAKRRRKKMPTECLQ